VGGFLAGKLVSYTLAGGLLGALGTLIALSPHTRAVVQVLAGLLIIAFGLAQLEVPGFRGFTVTPPESWIRFLRGRARSGSAIAPAILGFAAILVPCGVTLSVMALAMTSGSAWAGAATMAVFVVGTAPLFTLIGYAANKAATAWKGRLATATGIVVLISGLYALNGGLTLMDSPFAAKNLRAAFGGEPAIADSSTVTVANGQQTGVITVTSGRYSPANLAIKAGVPTTLVFRSENAYGCVAALVIPSLGVQEVLPENGDSKIDLGTPQAGRIDYSCAMGMYSGIITVS
jgi:sulfite exporter TauE/SafE